MTSPGVTADVDATGADSAAAGVDQLTPPPLMPLRPPSEKDPNCRPSTSALGVGAAGADDEGGCAAVAGWLGLAGAATGADSVDVAVDAAGARDVTLHTEPGAASALAVGAPSRTGGDGDDVHAPESAVAADSAASADDSLSTSDSERRMAGRGSIDSADAGVGVSAAAVAASDLVATASASTPVAAGSTSSAGLLPVEEATAVGAATASVAPIVWPTAASGEGAPPASSAVGPAEGDAFGGTSLDGGPDRAPRGAALGGGGARRSEGAAALAYDNPDAAADA